MILPFIGPLNQHLARVYGPSEHKKGSREAECRPMLSRKSDAEKDQQGRDPEDDRDIQLQEEIYQRDKKYVSTIAKIEAMMEQLRE